MIRCSGGREKEGWGHIRSAITFFSTNSMRITWQFGSEDPENSKNFTTITTWWKALQAQTVVWKQRLIPKDGNLDWSSQKYDESFTFFEADVRGITFYWRKEEADKMSGITPSKLEFAPALQRLYVYPESQNNLVIRIEIPEPVHQSFTIDKPGWFGEKKADDSGDYELIARDHVSHTEFLITLDKDNLESLRQIIDELQQ
ncbi:hypothetical protein CSA56_14195 [candidate division KSB3 bacterium]|uniref:Uncharacterized protein n=1 Tax=candidate division KSB3 bacterium TaxID=2044937 RepID=A0A2G6KAK7_9BACT|nr:MAG: hypothetical protein CSA56_14195 [candidate division KSB3 bacterium]